MRKVVSAILGLAFAVSVAAGEMSSTAPAQARAYIITPEDGQAVETRFTVRFGLAGMGVAPAGVERDNTGHHHLLIDTDVADLDLDMPLPATDQVKHFGGGQTETVLELPPGQHTLQLLLGNHLHVPHDPPVLSEKITITVK
jgi:hypothetical protein